MGYKILLVSFIVFFLTLVNSVAQPNVGFENWSVEYSSYENPDGWQTGNFLSLLNPPNPVSAFKAIGSDAHSGFYSLKVKSIHLVNNPWPDLLEDTTGAVFTGKIYPSPFSYKYGFPYNGRPEKLQLWAKYFPVGTDTAGVAVVLQKWNGTSRDTIAGGKIKILSTPIYSFIQVDLTYFSNNLPDTAAIILMPSQNGLFARVNSTLFVDDVLFTGWVGIDEQNGETNKVKAFPNPAKGSVNIQSDIEGASNVEILDVSGKIVGKYKIQNSQVNINTVLFPPGNYFYELLNNNGKALARGKFSVIK
jgi:hypothetical protein